MNYIDLFKNRIRQEVTKVNGNKQFVDSLFSAIKDDIGHAASLIGLGRVDEPTLESYFEIARKEYLSVNPIDPGISHALTKKGFVSWLDEEREARISWDYTERYLQYLSKASRPPKVIDETRRSSLSIVKKMADPESENSVFVKGLVVGAVQSGKTGNFNAVINRAIDSGYKLVIVLSGIMEDLRSQTQKRIEADVIGEGTDDFQRAGKKGVGEIRRFGVSGDESVIQVISITSATKDFGLSTKELDFTLNAKYVLVCKKNVSVLRNLIVWLHDSLEEGKENHGIPLLILDDEADNASLNNLGVKGREYASRTNSQIRALLALFSRKTYLGYTATPFANVLQDRNEIPVEKYLEKYKFKGGTYEKELKREGNLFPDDFIELLEAPSNYVGAKQVFETIKPIENATEENEKIPLLAPAVSDITEYFPTRVCETEDGETVGVANILNSDEWDRKIGESGYLGFYTYKDYRKGTRAGRKEDQFPNGLPESLRDAIKCFVLSLAIRQSRIPQMQNSDLYQPHNTMLIHISRFTNWQNTAKKLVVEYVKELVSQINNDKPSSAKSIYHELEKMWYRYYAHIVQHIKNYLPRGYEDEFMIPIVYSSIKQLLPEAVRGIEILAINSEAKDVLEYPKNSPKKIIAIGGNRLSRGFTLEGLTINYFVRTTNYSDALLQMGRWFGYRPGYLDCCKIFTTQDSIDNFNLTTKCIEELEGEFTKMEQQGKDPRSFAIRVKKHPGALQITRPSILKNAVVVKWSYQDLLVMTTRFTVTKDHIEKTWLNFRSKIAPRFDSEIDGLLTFGTTGEEIVRILKHQPGNFDEYQRETMSKFIELCNQKRLLTDWTVALKVTGSSQREFKPTEIGIGWPGVKKVQLAKRSGPTRNEGDKESFLEKGVFKASGKNANIVSSNTDLAILLSRPERAAAENAFYGEKARELQKKDRGLSGPEAMSKARTYKTIPERYYRERMSEKQGLLIIYLFDSHYVFNHDGMDSKDPKLKSMFEEYVRTKDIDLNIPLVGYAIGFPPIANDPGGEYMQGDYDLEVVGDEDSDVGDEAEILADLNEV